MMHPHLLGNQSCFLLLFSSLCSLCLCGKSLAQLDPEKDSPYELQIVVRVADHPPFTAAFKNQVKRELQGSLQAAYADLVRVEVVDTHPLLKDIDGKELQASLEGWKEVSPRKTHFVLIDFKNSVVIMTSNLGSHFMTEDVSEGTRRKVTDALREHFRPEFLNRIDEIVYFHSLDEIDLRHIVDLSAEGLRRMLRERELNLELTDAARNALAKEGYDPQFGARPLKRTIQRRIQNPLAMKLLAGEFADGDTIEIGTGPGGFTFRKRAPEPASA